ncbi:MAG TPA: DNA topoisomerase IB [Thermoanaerobaculia bacterium]|nr:DNA topoisomerase IB [Thermoanaerobaculia bacterium]
MQRARDAGLRYVSDEEPGIRRQRWGRGFTYRDSSGEVVRDEKVRARIDALAIPPAWTEVWICRSPKGHVQATGRDAKGRKQYRYHELWTEVSNATKFARMVPFAEALTPLRRRVRRDVKREDLDRERVLAALVRLLDRTLVRVGNDEYAKANDSYGLTTLLAEHAEVNGSDVHLEFRGKGGKEHRVDLHDRRVAAIVRECQEIPGQELFGYVDAEGTVHPVDSGEVNDYLREVMGADFTAKDFRTWAGTVAAVEALCLCAPCDSEREIKKNVVSAVKQVSELLRNTPAVCRQFYIHPAVAAAYEGGKLAAIVEQAAEAERDPVLAELRQPELRALAVLRASGL